MFLGHEGAVALLRDVEDTFTELQTDQSEFRDLGEQVIAVGHFRGRGRESGITAETPCGWLVEFRSGKAIRIREYLDQKEALEAAGRSQYAMSEEKVDRK